MRIVVQTLICISLLLVAATLLAAPMDSAKTTTTSQSNPKMLQASPGDTIKLPVPANTTFEVPMNVERPENHTQTVNISTQRDAIKIDLTVADDAKDKESSFYILAALILSIVAIVWNILTAAHQYFKNKKDRTRSIHDDYWFRTVVVPTVLKPLIEFADEQSESLVKLDRKNGSGDNVEIKYQEYLDCVQNKLIIFRKRCVLLKALDVGLVEDISKLFDDLEDQVANYCLEQSQGVDNGGVATRSSAFIYGKYFDVISDIVEAIKVKHLEAFDG